ncbi:ParA family protein, partial [Bacillus anthracis]|nr:ParA family protein [Bacillus anthracis]
MKFNKDVKEKLLFHVTINVIVIRNMIERLKVGDIMGKIIAIANQK